MFAGIPRKRDNVKIIQLNALNQYTLKGDDPDFIVLEALTANVFSGTTIILPVDSSIGKSFTFFLQSSSKLNPLLSNEAIYIISPLSTGSTYTSSWSMYSGQTPTFIFGPAGWISGPGGGNLSGTNVTFDLAIGAASNGANKGVAVGYNSSGYSSGVAVGYSSSGYNSGVAVGQASNGSSSGVAVGRNSNGYNSGVAVGYFASTNSKDSAVAIGYYSKAQRYREFVKAADNAVITLQSFSILNWYGDTVNATQTEIFLGAINQQATVLASSAFIFKLLAVARDNVNNVVAAWEITGAIKRDASNNTALVGTPVVATTLADTAAMTWSIAVSADTTNSALVVKVTGAAATTIRWNVRGDISELRF